MSSGTPYLGTKISLVSKSEIRYEGILYSIDTKESVVTLAQVRSFGTEDREAPKRVPPRDEVYEYIVFRGQDIKDLTVISAESHLPQDPAIVQSGSSRVPTPGYSHFPAPVSFPPHPTTYPPFGSPYGGYTPHHRPMPGPIPPHPAMMPPGPMIPPRIPTPPTVQPVPLSRSHTPSPETVTPVVSTSKTEDKRGDTAHDKSTAQQGTQTVQAKKKPSSRPSSRRGSVDKTAASQEKKKKQEVVDKETFNKDPTEETQSTEPQKQKQVGNRRPQGRRGSGPRVNKPRTVGGPVKFEGEFDFESSNAKFNKEEIEEELQQKLYENLRLKDEDESEAISAPENYASDAQPSSPLNYYDSSKSFFDSISCEAKDRNRNRRAHPSWQQERKVNMETFGVTGGMRRGGRGRGRGRGRGGYRGGRGGNRYQGHDGSSQGGRGGWRGGRGGSRGDRSRSYVDQPINGNDKLPRNLPNGPAMGGDGEAAAKA